MCEFEIIAHHQYPIPDGSYTLLCANPHGAFKSRLDNELSFWVIGQRLADQKLKKLSTFKMNMNIMALISRGIGAEVDTTYLA